MVMKVNVTRIILHFFYNIAFFKYSSEYKMNSNFFSYLMKSNQNCLFVMGVSYL